MLYYSNVWHNSFWLTFTKMCQWRCLDCYYSSNVLLQSILWFIWFRCLVKWFTLTSHFNVPVNVVWIYVHSFTPAYSHMKILLIDLHFRLVLVVVNGTKWKLFVSKAYFKFWLVAVCSKVLSTHDNYGRFRISLYMILILLYMSQSSKPI